MRASPTAATHANATTKLQFATAATTATGVSMQFLLATTVVVSATAATTTAGAAN